MINIGEFARTGCNASKFSSIVPLCTKGPKAKGPAPTCKETLNAKPQTLNPRSKTLNHLFSDHGGTLRRRELRRLLGFK